MCLDFLWAVCMTVFFDLIACAGGCSADLMELCLHSDMLCLILDCVLSYCSCLTSIFVMHLQYFVKVFVSVQLQAHVYF